MLKVLLADGDAAARSFLLQLMSSRFECSFLEAEDGLDALHLIETESPDVVFFEVGLPVVGGVELLEAVRGSPSLHHIAMVAVSTVTDQDVIACLAKLGVNDYLLKPLTLELALQRVRMIFDLVRRRPSRTCVGTTGDLKEQLLIIDKDINFRAFARHLLERRFEVHEADSGVAGAKLFMATLPRVVCIGQGLPLLNEKLFVKTMRTWWDDATPGLGEHPIFCLITTEQNRSVSDAPFDIVIRKSFVPSTFLADFNRTVLGEERTVDRMRALVQREISPQLVTATEQIFGVLTGQEVRVSTTSADLTNGLLAALDLGCQEQEVLVTMGIVASSNDVKSVAATIVGGELSCQQEAADAWGELINNIAGRVHAAIGEHGINLVQNTPTVTQIENYPESHDCEWMCNFQTENGARFLVFLKLNGWDT